MKRRRAPRVLERLYQSSVDSVTLFRVTLRPQGQNLPESHALDPESDLTWQPALREALPLSLTWRRATPSRWEVVFPLELGARCLGLGERYGGLNLRGRLHTLLATDNPQHDESADPLYKSIPFLIIEQGKRSLGLFIDSPAPQRWNLDRELGESAAVHVLSRRGLALYLIGPAPVPELVRVFTQLTGRSSLPPRWSLGHQQSRWSYPNEKAVREIAAQFRRRRLPCDAVVVDIDYMDRFRVFTISKRRFPHFERMVRDLAGDGFRVVVIVDPGVSRSVADPTFRQGKQQDVFCRTAQGRLFVDKVWPGPACFPDFLRPEVRAFWSSRLDCLLSRGVAGIWNDMNEPSFFRHRQVLEPRAQGLPPRSRELFLQATPEGPVGHLEVRNLYGHEMSHAAWEAIRERRPDERPFVLSRSCYAGIQRFSAVWLGDNKSWFEHLRLSIPMLLNLGISGVPFCGADVGGFGGDTDGELLARWYQVGIFYPFLRNHCALGHAAQEPWAFGPKVEACIRRLLETRYRLIPYLETLFAEHLESGAPILRPLCWHHPDDPIARSIDDQFFFGGDILVAPILTRGQTRRPIYLPPGLWHPFDGGRPLRGPGYQSMSWALDRVPALVRDGAILPLARAVQHTGELATAPILFRIFGRRARGRYWQDDGGSFAYQRGEFNDWRLSFERGQFSAQAVHLGYQAPRRAYFYANE